MNTEEKIIHDIYYAPKNAVTSPQELHKLLKSEHITLKKIKEFVEKQESYQLFKPSQIIKNYFPITSNYKNQIWQIDLVDISNNASVNKNYHYILICIDICSRFVYAVPLKNKNANSVDDAMILIFKSAKPTVIECDKGSEFTNTSFKNLMNKNNIEIRYCEVGDHHKLGIIDRFVKTLRYKINKYVSTHQTVKYIDALPSIIHSYNNTYHRGIEKKPSEVKNIDKYNVAMPEEQKFNIGDKVRYLLNFNLFEKRSAPKWSHTVHNIMSTNNHSYVLDNGMVKKYYELQLIHDVQKPQKVSVVPTLIKIAKENKSKRSFNKTGLYLSRIIKSKQ